MPTFRGQGDAPVVQFDPTVEVSPFALFRRMRDGSPPLRVDIRALAVGAPDSDRSLEGAERPRPGPWAPSRADEDVVLFDDNGTDAVDLARRLQREGYPRVRALFGGLDLYEFSLDPEIVGTDTFLVRRSIESD